MQLAQYSEWHAAVLKRDNYTCVLCGKKRNLEVDHIVPMHKIRTRREYCNPGGGGINVARVFVRLGGNARCIYLSGGPIGVALDGLIDLHQLVRTRGIRHGSLWMTFHGLQWPYYPKTGIGVAGYAFRKVDLPVAPMVLTLVLTPLMERTLRQSLEMSGGDMWIFAERPPTVIASSTRTFTRNTSPGRTGASQRMGNGQADAPAGSRNQGLFAL